MSEKKNKKQNGDKCRIKCRDCQFYDREGDYCTERDIENCTKLINMNFSQCNSFLIRENLVMF